ncbi:MAG: hypothetical protein ACRD90_06740 [Nitrosopumilaceae archaeon]
MKVTAKNAAITSCFFVDQNYRRRLAADLRFGADLFLAADLRFGADLRLAFPDRLFVAIKKDTIHLLFYG